MGSSGDGAGIYIQHAVYLLGECRRVCGDFPFLQGRGMAHLCYHCLTSLKWGIFAHLTSGCCSVIYCFPAKCLRGSLEEIQV